MESKTPRQYLNLPDLQWTIPQVIQPSTHDSDIVIDSWMPMDGFNRDNIDSLFCHVLDKNYYFPPSPPLVEDAHLLIGNEACLEFAVGNWNLPIVNTTVRVVTDELEQLDTRLLWSKGAAAHMDGGLTPDWSAVENTNLHFTRPGWVVGESKMFPKGFPRRPEDGNALLAGKAKKCIEQVLNYASRWNTRYAYLITPYELVIIRGNLNPSTSAQFTTRAQGQLPFPATLSAPSRQNMSDIYAPQRVPPSSMSQLPMTPPRQQQQRFPAVTPTSARGSPSTAADSDSTYQQSPIGERRARMMTAEVEVIPWNNNNRNGLSANLAMFAVHMLAKIKNSLEEKYLPIHKDPVYRKALGLD